MAQALYSPTSYSPERKRLKPADVITRAAVVELSRRLTGQHELEERPAALRRVYGECLATRAYIQRAAVSPANTTTATWAAELVQTSIADFLAGPQGASAFAQLSDKALSVSLPPGTSLIKVPSRASPQTLVGAWVAENGAKPVTTIPLGTVDLTPCKLACISLFSEEMLTHAVANLEAIVSEILRHDLVALLDSALLDATAASAVRPAGLFNGATSVTASAATPALSAMVADLKGLAAAVAGSTNPDAAASTVFVVNPAQAIHINLLAPQYSNLIVSGYMAAGSVGAIDASSVAMLVANPEFKLSHDATIHMESASPLPLGTGTQGSGVLAVPMHSTFQSDTIAIRSVLRAGWIKRRATATALASAVTW